MIPSPDYQPKVDLIVRFQISFTKVLGVKKGRFAVRKPNQVMG